MIANAANDIIGNTILACSSNADCINNHGSHMSRCGWVDQDLVPKQSQQNALLSCDCAADPACCGTAATTTDAAALTTTDAAGTAATTTAATTTAATATGAATGAQAIGPAPVVGADGSLPFSYCMSEDMCGTEVNEGDVQGAIKCYDDNL